MNYWHASQRLPAGGHDTFCPVNVQVAIDSETVSPFVLPSSSLCHPWPIGIPDHASNAKVFVIDQHEWLGALQLLVYCCMLRKMLRTVRVLLHAPGQHYLILAPSEWDAHQVWLFVYGLQQSVVGP